MRLSNILGDFLNESTVNQLDTYSALFREAQPYKHVIIDNFLEPLFANRLEAAFPKFDARFALDELGRVGRKAVVSNLQSLDEPFREADYAFRSTEFLQWVEQLTGIRSLAYDADNFGGGTHENAHGQELLPHVDFNFHPVTKKHRRLNIIIYLNPIWRAEWGGAIAVHSNPRNPSEDVVAKYPPFFNRCIVFETNEYSWHGFDKIVIPPEFNGVSRRSLSIYLYTDERAEEESFAPHATFYIPRPLPNGLLVEGRTLDSHDVETIEYGLIARDELISMLQRQEADRNGSWREMQQLKSELDAALASLKLPILGYAFQVGETAGLFADGWALRDLRFSLRPQRRVKSLTLTGFVWPSIITGATFEVLIDGRVVETAVKIADGKAHITVSEDLLVGETYEMTLRSGQSINLNAEALGDDKRDLAIRIETILLEHQEQSDLRRF